LRLGGGNLPFPPGRTHFQRPLCVIGGEPPRQSFLFGRFFFPPPGPAKTCGLWWWFPFSNGGSNLVLWQNASSPFCCGLSFHSSFFFFLREKAFFFRGGISLSFPFPHWFPRQWVGTWTKQVGFFFPTALAFFFSGRSFLSLGNPPLPMVGRPAWC